jgi:Arc/MetJ-type ribon-helix-helix transcriptional regulator
MNVQLTKPELQRFVDEKVRGGEFAIPEAVVEDALSRMMEADTLTDDDWEAIRRADEEVDRGESVEWDAFAAALQTAHTPGQSVRAVARPRRPGSR